ncbi:hypothetical protein [Sphingomonas sp. VNH70]|jgi:hypothetical protein|uniref:hypothetical protein n=1 Tax=Sphingomonas silueang TaxID=3156617 RepID=UPI0032B43735
MENNEDEDDAQAFATARALIDQHGERVAAFLQEKIDGLMASDDFEALSRWFAIRNAVAITLEANTTIQ